MTRRGFMAQSVALGAGIALNAKELDGQSKRLIALLPLIAAVQEHMFPPQSSLPSASQMNMSGFLQETIMHQSYDKDIRRFVIEGAQELHNRTSGKFIAMTQEQKERALRRYEQSDYGSNWLSRIMTLGMEALFSDPIYGSNINEAGWRSTGSEGGMPRPAVRYIAL